MIKLNPLQMRFRIEIQYKAISQDSNGITSTVWTTLASGVSASVLGLSGRELEVVGQQAAQYNARVMIYKRTDIDESMRILFDGRTYAIIDIIPDPTNNLYMSLMCKTGFTNG